MHHQWFSGVSGISIPDLPLAQVTHLRLWSLSNRKYPSACFPSYSSINPGRNCFPSLLPIKPGRNCFPSYSSINPGRNCFPSYSSINPGRNCFPSYSSINPGRNCFPSYSSINPGRNCFPSYSSINPGRNCFPSLLPIKPIRNCFPSLSLTKPGCTHFPSLLPTEPGGCNTHVVTLLIGTHFGWLCLLVHGSGQVCLGSSGRQLRPFDMDSRKLAFMSGMQRPASSSLRRLSLQVLTLLGGAKFIAWRLRWPFLGECRQDSRHFWSC